MLNKRVYKWIKHLGVVHEHELLPSQEGLLAEKDEDGDSMKTDHTAGMYNFVILMINNISYC